jgi:hypothetical protein
MNRHIICHVPVIGAPVADRFWSFTAVEARAIEKARPRR